jgi:hypothetical protein
MRIQGCSRAVQRLRPRGERGGVVEVAVLMLHREWKGGRWKDTGEIRFRASAWAQCALSSVVATVCSTATES